MHIHCLGLNYQDADIALREQLAMSEDAIRAALARLGCGTDLAPGGVSEMVILSTCNRVEIYANAPQSAFDELELYLADITAVPLGDFQSYLYRYEDQIAVEHLLRVASGLDSMVLGEPQILGQVADAYGLARSQGTVGKVMTKLFHTAIHAGKRAHTETRISHNPASVSSQAVLLVSQLVSSLPSSKVVVLGAGEMAELAVEGFRKRGVEDITVVNRTLERARELAEGWGGRVMTFEDLSRALIRADILITSTGAPHTLIGKSKVEEVIAQRKDRPLVILDIAVPRDVEEDVRELEGVSVYDIDDIHEHLEDSLAHREKEVPAVEEILREEQDHFKEFLKSLDVDPVIGELHQLCEEIREEELARTLDRLSSTNPEDVELLEAMTEAMVKKFLHGPIKRLKREAGGADVAEYTTITKDLFGLNGTSRDLEPGKPTDHE